MIKFFVSILAYFVLITSSFASQITWDFLISQEEKSKEWVTLIGDEDLIALGRINQWPAELEIVAAFYPSLLPEKFFNASTMITCQPFFVELRKYKNETHYRNWKQCIRELWRQEAPELIEKALSDLKDQLQED